MNEQDKEAYREYAQRMFDLGNPRLVPSETWQAALEYARGQQEPVAWMCDVLQADATFKRELSFETPPPDGTYYSIRGRMPLYTHPAPAAAINEQLLEALRLLLDRIESPDGKPILIARAAIAKAEGRE